MVPVHAACCLILSGSVLVLPYSLPLEQRVPVLPNKYLHFKTGHPTLADVTMSGTQSSGQQECKMQLV